MSLEACFEKAEYLIQQAEQGPPKPMRKIGPTKWKSFQRKVRETFSDALKSQNETKLRSTSNLLASVASKLTSPRLVINLLPVNNGYSITLMKNDGTYAEMLNMSYDEQELLDFVDNEELPPLLVDSLHRLHPNAFHCGSVLAEIKDYRIASSELSYETRYVLLKPTAQTLKNDVNIIVDETSSSYKWGTDDKLTLESYLTLATSEPLCLDTSPAVAIIKNRLQAKKKQFNTVPFRRMIRKNGIKAQWRKQAFKTRPAPKPLKLYDFLQKRKGRQNEQSATTDLKLRLSAVDVWRKSPLLLNPPEEVATDRHATPFLLPEATSLGDIIEVQSMLLESEGGNRDVCSRITIGQRPRDMQYFGMLQSNKYFKYGAIEDKMMNQIFSLGTEHRANLYILQYQELFTEDGRRPAKVTLSHANKDPEVYRIPNQQQPWQLAHERSAYSVGSVINIPVEKWRKMSSVGKSDIGLLQQQASAALKQKAMKQLSNSSHVASTPTLNAITLQNAAQSAFPFPGPASVPTATSRRVSKVKSTGSVDGSTPVPSGRRSRQGSDFGNTAQRLQAVPDQNQVQDGGVKYTAQIAQDGNSQSYTLNPSALAAALNQIGGGAVSLQLPVVTMNTQGASNANTQNQGSRTATAVLRMPVDISGVASNSGQITAALNLIGNGQNVLSSNILGNIQLTTGTGGITIPASQLSGLQMQLANASNQQQISLVPATTQQTTNVPAQQLSLVEQPSASNPITIVANENWQVQDASNQPGTQQQTYTISPRAQIVTTNGRSAAGQGLQQQQVQVLQQLRILNTIATTSEPVTVQQLMAAASKHNQNRMTTE